MHLDGGENVRTIDELIIATEAELLRLREKKDKVDGWRRVVERQLARRGRSGGASSTEPVESPRLENEPPAFSPETQIFLLLKEAKQLARTYRQLTGKSLGIISEVAEYEAARFLGLQLAPNRKAGFDAVDPKTGMRYLIKGRYAPERPKPGQRLGAIDISKEFDAVLLVLLNENFDAVAMYEAERAAVVAALRAPGSKAPNERHALRVARLMRTGRCLWPLQQPEGFIPATPAGR